MTNEPNADDRTTGTELLGLIPVDMDEAVGTRSQREKVALALLAPFALPFIAAAVVIVLVVEGGAALLGKLLATPDGDGE